MADANPGNTNNIQEEVKQLLGKSWYDAEVEYRRETNRISCTRIVFVGLLNHHHSPDKSSSKTQYHHGADSSESIDDNGLATEFYEMMKQYTTTTDPGQFTGGGMILIAEPQNSKLPTSMLGFLEASSPRIAYDVLRTIRNKTSKSLHSVRIIISSEDCPCREFAKFGIYVASPDSEEEFDIDAEGGGHVEVASGILDGLCHESLNFSPDVVDGGVTKLVGEKKKAIPSAKRVGACACSELFPTLDEFLDLFDSPIYLELESDRVFPLRPVINY